MKNKIKEIRQSKGFSQIEFAKKIGVAQSGVSYMEKGIYNPTLNVLLKILQTLDCKFEDLGFEEEKEEVFIRKVELEIFPISQVIEAVEMTVAEFKTIRYEVDAPRYVILTDMGGKYPCLMVDESYMDKDLVSKEKEKGRVADWVNYSQYVTDWDVK